MTLTDNVKHQTEIRHRAEEAAALFPVLLVEAVRIAHTVATGLHGRRRAGPGETFWQHRPYIFGDPVSAIDWRQSARIADRLYIRQNEWEAASAVYLWRDPSQSLDFSSGKNTPTKCRRAEVLGIALSILLSQAGERVGLLGHDRRPFHGRTTPTRLLEALYLSKTTDITTCEVPTPQLPAGASIVLFSDFFADIEQLGQRIERLASAGNKGVLVQICDPAEEDFPYQGRVEFQNVAGAEKLTFGETTALQQDYKSRFAAHRDTISDLARHAGWNFIAHRTDRPAQTALLALYTALGSNVGGPQ